MIWRRRHTPIASHGHGTSRLHRPHLGRTLALHNAPHELVELRRQIGSVRRECLDQILVLGEAHLRRSLISYAAYYNSVRTHRSLHQDAPIFRPIQQIGIIRSHPILGGLHHHYVLIGLGSRRRSASEAIDLPSGEGVTRGRLFPPQLPTKPRAAQNQHKTGAIAAIRPSRLLISVRTCRIVGTI
jgi:Integrase core domain